ncbi:rhamnogalacturonan acetylesterase [Pedobacter sp.]|uniref:rhamnogalacturonan acetylesterase n=1 Tax=Pedobacter sp. TaxID=1411316 RepID=UPI003BA8F3C9
MKKNIWLLSTGMLITILLCSVRNKFTTIYLIGDSTVCDQDIKRYPVTGWGTPFADYFNNEVVVKNHAKGGRSTRTFLEENRWQPIVNALNPGDYVMIQFGHNDEAKEPQYAARYTSVPDYKRNLNKFIHETRAKGAFPILITPVSRRSFKAGIAQPTHQDYTAAVLALGEEQAVPVVDLDAKSREQYQLLGESKSKWLFMELDSAEHPIYPLGRHDNTHFNDYGARVMAEIVLKEIKSLKLPLANSIVKGNKARTVR